MVKIQVFCLCLVVFLAAFLLFQIEPLIGKIVTLHYGGTASVWTICILFFQTVVLAGYFVTFLLAKLRTRMQVLAYITLALISLIWSAIPIDSAWDCRNVADPVPGLMYSLTVYLAIPCIILATVSGMMQLWFNVQKLGNPYPLYSVSNIGSIGALLAYPTVVEPSISISKTLSLWSYIYWLFIATLLFAAVTTWSHSTDNSSETKEEVSESARITARTFSWWCFLSAMGSITLLAYTSYMTGDIAPMPLLWVLPLSVYLLTFVLVFSNHVFYKRIPYILVWIMLVIIEPLVINSWQIPGLILNLFLVFVTCMIFHGELVESKPIPTKLPTFYLALALGGALGGVFVGIVAPSIFTFDAERLIVIFALAIMLLYRFALSKFIHQNNHSMIILTIGIVIIGLAVFTTSLTPRNLVYWDRNFYGSVKVLKEGDYLTFCSGRINHGQQFRDQARKREPAGHYWIPMSLIFNALRYTNNGPLNCGDVGLGVGVTAAFGQPGDQLTFYELDPKVEAVARKYFTYLSQSNATIAVHIGDGRAVLSEQPARNYDLLILDAFNGDAIPCHLLTKESLEVYLKHLKPNGWLAFHISNTYLDLQPVLGALARSLGLHAITITYADHITYVVMARNVQSLDHVFTYYAKNRHDFPSVEISKTRVDPKLRLWTDDYTNLASVIKLHN